MCPAAGLAAADHPRAGRLASPPATTTDTGEQNNTGPLGGRAGQQ